MEFAHFTVTPIKTPEPSFYLDVSRDTGAFRIDTGPHRTILDVEDAFERPLRPEIRKQMRAQLFVGEPFTLSFEDAFEPLE